MPRLSFNHFTTRRRFLQEVWQHHQVLYTLIPPAQQRSLHAYYRPSEHLDHYQLRTHWQTIAHHAPGLPSRASKANLRLRRADSEARARGDEPAAHIAITRPVSRRRHTKRGRTIRIGAVARPQVHVDKLVQGLTLLVKDEQQREREVG